MPRANPELHIDLPYHRNRHPLWDAARTLCYVEIDRFPGRLWRVIEITSDPDHVPQGVMRWKLAEVQQLPLGAPTDTVKVAV